MSKIILIAAFLLVASMAIVNGEDLRIRDNLKPIAEKKCINEGKTFTGFGMNKDFYYCNSERRGFSLNELKNAQEVVNE